MARILIAEHNQTASAFIYNALKKDGNTIEVADNCLDAWRLSAREAFDVLLIDVAMPGVDSFVLAQKALLDNPHIQIIFITGFAGIAMDTYATPSYAPAPITSAPFHLKDIAARVRYQLGRGSLPPARLPADAANVIYARFGQSAEAQQAR